MTKKNLTFSLILGAFFLLCVNHVSATTIRLGFESITNNNLGDASIGESQLFVDVTDEGVSTGQVLFTFLNTGLEACAISEVYFDDGSLLGISSLIDADEGGGDLGVDFTGGSASPGDLPGGNSITPAFNVTAGFLADADSPPAFWGVDPGESLGIVFNLQADQGIDDVLAALTLPQGGEWLRIGLHVIDFASGGSESFVNIPYDGNGPNPAEIPEPATFMLFGVGLLGLARISRKKK